MKEFKLQFHCGNCGNLRHFSKEVGGTRFIPREYYSRVIGKILQGGSMVWICVVCIEKGPIQGVKVSNLAI